MEEKRIQHSKGNFCYRRVLRVAWQALHLYLTLERFDEVRPDTIVSELGINDVDGTPLFENDYIEDIRTHEVYCLRYNPEFPFSAIHPFAFKASAGHHCLEKFRLVSTPV